MFLVLFSIGLSPRHLGFSIVQIMLLSLRKLSLISLITDSNNFLRLFSTKRLIFICITKFICNQQFYCLMLSKYYGPPQIKGRDLKVSAESRGKKHFWGEKGKNYGFYTTNDEIEMQRRYRHHRRLQKHPQLRQYSQRRVPTQSLKYQEDQPKQKHNAIHHSAAIPKINPQEISMNLKQKLQLQLDKKKHLRIQTKNVDFSLSPKHIDIKLPEIKVNSSRRQLNDIRSEIKKARREDVDIVYYTKRDRAYNPTFCNSPTYPLPCFRYIP